MFKAIKDNKIIAISEKKEVIIHTEDGDIVQEVTGEALFPCLVFDEVIEDTEHTIDDYKCYDDEFTLHDIDKDNEYAKKARASAYALEVDPLHFRKQRKTILEEWTEDDEREYILKVKELSDKIAKEYPYEAKKQ